jgi:transposase
VPHDVAADIAPRPRAAGAALVWRCSLRPAVGDPFSTWACRGHQPLVKTAGKRKGDNVFDAIEYVTGRCWSQGQAGRLHAEADSAFRTCVLAQVTQPLMLIHEGARYHPSVALQRCLAVHSERLMVFQLPRYAPDDHPIEKLWKKVKKAGTHGQCFPTFQALTDTVEHALLTVANTPKEILSWCSLPTELAQAAYVRIARKSFS